MLARRSIYASEATASLALGLVVACICLVHSRAAGVSSEGLLQRCPIAAPAAYQEEVRQNPARLTLPRRALHLTPSSVKAQLRVPAGITRLRGGGRSKEDMGKGKTDKVIGSKVGKSPKKSTPKKAASKGKRKKESDGSSGSEEGGDSESEDDDDDEVEEV
jgi:hypothetical protein